LEIATCWEGHPAFPPVNIGGFCDDTIFADLCLMIGSDLSSDEKLDKDLEAPIILSRKGLEMPI
jgi:hypothetical protein